ncbi:MAG: hypothetical protein GEU78_17885, partial [Actinobacteria bacterium]|nr:hypothetical protein [Actinomycetota bacterium]
TASGVTSRVSIDSNGVEGNKSSSSPSLSSDGRYVAFSSHATNLVPGHMNQSVDVFVHDRDTGETTLVSKNSSGSEGDSDSVRPAISADGRYIAFDSFAENLVNGDTNDDPDVFVHDTTTQDTTRVSVNSDGNEANGRSLAPAISADGRFVAFHSFASNLGGDTNDVRDVFVHDTTTGDTSRVSVRSDGAEGNEYSVWPAISEDGRHVAFFSRASNLVSSDNNDADDVFAHDRETGETTRLSVDGAGTEGNNDSRTPVISGDGRYVSFTSLASNLVPGDTNKESDVFVHDQTSGDTTRISVDSTGIQANSSSTGPALSADARYVAFDSFASNLVADDTNGVDDVFVHQYLPDPPPSTTTTSTTTTVPPPDDEDFFTDDDGHLFEDDINAIAAAGITRGCNPPANDNYCPDDSFLRGQAAAFVRRALDVPASATDHFGDDDGNIFEDDINAIATAGITRGCNPPANDRYCPDDSFLRGQAAAFVRRALGLP